jgi:hypothetical protein
MDGDMVAALGRATIDGQTLFGHNSGPLPGPARWLNLTRGRPFAPGEVVRTQHLELPQARETCTVLGSQPRGLWGYDHGVNAHGVGVGRTPLRTRLAGAAPTGLLGTDLVRLVLERCRTARQGVDLLTDLVTRHGQGTPGDPPCDNAFLVVDPTEGFAVEAAGTHWVYQQLREVRALSTVSTVRGDWDRISRGLSALAIDHGWWPEDGSKLDFAGSLCPTLAEQGPALRRWGRTTLLLGEQNGHIDAAFVRRVLTDLDERPASETPSLRGLGPKAPATAASLVTQLAGDGRPRPVWCAFGPPRWSVYFPVFLDGDLPVAFTDGVFPGMWERVRQLATAAGQRTRKWEMVQEGLSRLQARFDQEAEEFAAEAAALKERGEGKEVPRQAGLFMQHCVEAFEEVWADAVAQPRAERRLTVS